MMEQNLLKPDIFSYSTSVSQLPWIGALSMMLRMTQHSQKPNVVTYGALGSHLELVDLVGILLMVQDNP